MELSLQLLRESMIMFIMVLAGLALAKTRLVNESECAILSRINVYLFMPCLLFNSFMTRWTGEKLQNLLVSIVGAVVIHLVFLVMTHFFMRVFPIAKVDGASLIYTNAAAIIIPLIVGTIGTEYVPYSAGFMMVATAFLWTHGVWLLGSKDAIQPKKILTNPPIIAAILGLLVMALSIEVPPMFTEVTQTLGSCMAPISMIQIGIVCAGFDLAHLKRIRTIWITVALRLLVYPVVAIAVLAVLNRLVSLPNDWEVFFVIMLCSSGPSGVMVTQLAHIFGVDTDRASCINVVTTALCVLTMPAMTLLAQLIM